MIEPLVFSYVFSTAFFTVIALTFYVDDIDDYKTLSTLGAVFIWPIVLPVFMVACIYIFITRLNEELTK